jgi:hypothetical protein
MANQKQVLDKIARNLDILSIPESRGANYEVIVANGSNTLIVTYVSASIQSPMGGVDDTISPYLGMGIANPGKIQIQSSISTAGTIADVIDGNVAAQLFAMCSGFANDIILMNQSGSYSHEFRGDVDNLNMGN